MLFEQENELILFLFLQKLYVSVDSIIFKHPKEMFELFALVRKVQILRFLSLGSHQGK